MPLTIAESLALLRRARDLLSDVVEVDPERDRAVRSLWRTLQDSMAMHSPGGRRVTRRESRAILAGSLAVVRRALVVDPSRYLVITAALVDLASDLVAEWED